MVVLAACHSEVFGLILREVAKVPHVVCIKKQFKVREDAMSKFVSKLVSRVTQRQ